MLGLLEVCSQNEFMPTSSAVESLAGTEVYVKAVPHWGEPHIDGTAGRFHILLWYDRHPCAAVGRTKYVGLP